MNKESAKEKKRKEKIRKKRKKKIRKNKKKGWKIIEIIPQSRITCKILRNGDLVYDDPDNRDLYRNLQQNFIKEMTKIMTSEENLKAICEMIKKEKEEISRKQMLQEEC